MARRAVFQIALLAMVAVTAAFAADPNRPEPGEERYFVEFRRFDSESSRSVRDAGGRPVYEFGQYRAIAAWLSDQARERLQRNPNVQSIQEDPRRYPMSETQPYGITMVEADQVSDSSAGNRMICVIDSGYYRNHEDLSAAANVTGTSDSGTGNWYEDSCGHGSHVAGTVSALTNSYGVLGVLPHGTVRLHIVKVFDGAACGWSYSSSLINALNVCRGEGANVVSMSLGGSVKSAFEESAFSDAYGAGVLSVAAAGNDGSTRKSYPASYDSVISVAAIDQSRSVASFSQKNSQVELAAPGVGVLSTLPWVTEDSLTVDGGAKYLGSHIENSAYASVGGVLLDGGLCTDVGASWTDAVVLCQRGSVDFYTKVSNVQAGGGRAAAIYNNVSGGFLGTLGDGHSSTIPAISLSLEDGVAAKSKVNLSSTLVSLFGAGSGYEAWDGTSMATPHVSAVAALVWSYGPTWTNVAIRNALDATAQDLGAAGRDTSYGFGLVQAKKALDYLEAASLPTPTPSIQPTPTPTQGVCELAGSSCDLNSDCCSSRCSGKPGRKTCK